MRTKAYWEDKLSEASEKVRMLRNQLCRLEMQNRWGTMKLKRRAMFAKPEIIAKWRYIVATSTPRIAQLKREILRIQSTKIAFYQKQITALDERTVWDRLRSGDGLRI